MKLKHGDVVECAFLDHCEDGDVPIEFIVWGRIEKIGKKHLVIVSWSYSDGKSRDDYNEKKWVIVRSAVTRIHTLHKNESKNTPTGHTV
jgi:hypothetical protein